VALGIQCQHADGVVVVAVAGNTTALGIDLRLVLLGLQPLAPGRFGLRRQQVLALETLLHRELLRASPTSSTCGLFSITLRATDTGCRMSTSAPLHHNGHRRP
jgi:hypothetical protein